MAGDGCTGQQIQMSKKSMRSKNSPEEEGGKQREVICLETLYAPSRRALQRRLPYQGPAGGQENKFLPIRSRFNINLVATEIVIEPQSKGGETKGTEIPHNQMALSKKLLESLPCSIERVVETIRLLSQSGGGFFIFLSPALFPKRFSPHLILIL